MPSECHAKVYFFLSLQKKNNLLLYKNKYYCIHCYALCFPETHCWYEL